MQPIILQLDVTSCHCNYIGHAFNYKIYIIYYMGYMVYCATNMQLILYKMNTCHKENGLR